MVQASVLYMMQVCQHTYMYDLSAGCPCVSRCQCVRTRASERALKIGSMDKILRFTNTLIIIK